MKNISRSFLYILLTTVALSSCKLADIRTKVVKNKTESIRQKGKKLLSESYVAMGMNKLINYQTYTVEYEEQYYGVGKFINKFKANPIELTIDFIPQQFTGRATVENGKKKGNRYYHNKGKTYYKSAKGKEQEKNKIASFWLPTHQYFLEFPLRIQEASEVVYAGDTVVNDKAYHLVMASWNTIEPQKEIDQYLIAINKTTNFIDYIQFTVRDVAGFVITTAKYNKFIQKNGISYPANITVHGKRYDSKKLYEMRVNQVTFDKVENNTVTEF